MKAIFLDFDGPIIPEAAYFGKAKAVAHPPCIAALNRITDATGALIVVSSTWRADGLPAVRGYLKKWGATGKVIGITPHLQKKNESGIWSAAPRGLEIAQYITNWNRDFPNDEISAFVILDDDRDMDYLLPFLIHTPFEKGLTEADAKLAIERLGELDGINKR